MGIEGQSGAQEIDLLINDHWSYIAEVTICCDELVEIEQCNQVQNSPSERWSSITVTEDRFNQMIQMTAQMQQMIIGQQQMHQQQQQFLDSFEAAVHVNTSLSNMEKLNYLISKLTGEAENSVSGIFLSNENYQVAVELLKERYGDKQAVVTSHYTEMINLNKLKTILRVCATCTIK